MWLLLAKLSVCKVFKPFSNGAGMFLFPCQALPVKSIHKKKRWKGSSARFKSCNRAYSIFRQFLFLPNVLNWSLFVDNIVAVQNTSLFSKHSTGHQKHILVVISGTNLKWPTLANSLRKLCDSSNLLSFLFFSGALYVSGIILHPCSGRLTAVLQFVLSLSWVRETLQDLRSAGK